MDESRLLLEQMQPLMLPIPPMLERALAYLGRSRFVAFYWSQDGGGLTFDDGQIQGLGYSPAWHSFTEHPHIAPYLTGLNFGSEEQTAEHYLVLDRQARQAYAGDLVPTMHLLFHQAQHELRLDVGPQAPTLENQTPESTEIESITPKNWSATLDMERWLDTLSE